jgi:hypothetical protein
MDVLLARARKVTLMSRNVVYEISDFLFGSELISLEVLPAT